MFTIYYLGAQKSINHPKQFIFRGKTNQEVISARAESKIIQSGPAKLDIKILTKSPHKVYIFRFKQYSATQ